MLVFPSTLPATKISYKTIYGEQGDVILLESAFPDVRAGSWILLKSSAEGGDVAAFRVTKAESGFACGLRR